MEKQRGGFAARLVGVIIGLLGLSISIGGVYLLALGGSAYYTAAGLGLMVSGGLLWVGDERGAWLYGAVLVATFAWAVLDAGPDALAIVARTGVLTGLGLPLLAPAVRRGLTWRASSTPRPTLRWGGGIAVVVIAVACVLAPRVPPPTEADVAELSSLSRSFGVPGSESLSADWTSYGHDLTGNKYSPAAMITRANVARLKLVWSVRTGDFPSGHFSFESTPLEVDGTVFVCTPRRRVIALDATTGTVRWRWVPPRVFAGDPNAPNCRGLSFHRGEGAADACDRRVFVSTLNGELWALNAQSGEPCSGFGRNGFISLLDGLGPNAQRDWRNTGPGTVAGNLIVLGGRVRDNQSIHMPSGVIRAFDVHSGRLTWAWDMGHPDRVGPPPPDEPYTESTPNAWAPFAVDTAASLVFVPTGNPAPDFFGSYRRPFDERFGSSLVALDLRTGRPRWSFQMAHHDLWDLDAPAQPLLTDWPTPSGSRRAVVQFSKSGDIYVLDRLTGQPIVPVHERPVSREGGLPQDHSAATQPASALSLAPRRLRESDMWGLTPVDELLCRIAFRQSRYAGVYTLPGLTPAIGYPHSSGILSWGGGAVDPRRDTMVVSTTYVPFRTQALPRSPGDTRILSASEMGLVEMAGTPYRFNSVPFLSALKMPCTRPPWGELIGVDIASSKLRWRQPLGTGEESGPFGFASHIPLSLGTPSQGGVLLTAGGLAFIAATPDRRFRALDTLTGRILWQVRLPASGNATPMSYVARGKQFVVIAAGGHAYAPSTPGDYVIAFALED